MKKNTEWVQEISGKLIEKLLAKELGIEVENLKLLKYSCELITRENGECYYLNFDLDVYPEIVKNIKGISELGSLDIEESVIDVDKKFNVFLNTLLNTELYSKFLSEIKLLRESIEYLNENNIVIEFIKFQLYSSMVTFMESYLKDTLMNIVLFNESINTKFIETFKSSYFFN